MDSINTQAVKVVRDIRGDWRELAKNDLYFLCKFVLGYDDLVPDAHMEMCKFIQGPAQWKLFVGSRGILKTTICTISRAIQVVLNNPNSRCLIMQSNDNIARGPLSQIREKFENCQILKDLFPEIIPSDTERRRGRWSDQWVQVTRSKTYSEPTFRAIGVSGGVVGTHWTHIFRDDIVAAKRDSTTDEIIAPSREDVEKAIGQHKLVHGIMENPSTCEVYDICNRWSNYDFVQYLLDSGEYLNKEESNHTYMVSPVRDPITDELLWKERFTDEICKRIEQDQGSYFWATQYRCDPIDSTRSLFKRKDLRFWVKEKLKPDDVLLPPLEELQIYAVMDQAQKISQRACYTATVVVGIDIENRWFILETNRQRINATDKIDLIFQIADRWGIYGRNIFGIESNIAQGILVEWLREQSSIRGKILNLNELRPPTNLSKDMRIEALQPYFEQHRVFIKAGDSQDDLIKELTNYPFGRYRDLIDALSYVHRIRVARKHRGSKPHYGTFSYEGIMQRLKGTPQKSFFKVQDSCSQTPEKVAS